MAVFGLVWTHLCEGVSTRAANVQDCFAQLRNKAVEVKVKVSAVSKKQWALLVTVFGVVCTFLGVFLTAAVIPSVTKTEALAIWTAQKDFFEWCESESVSPCLFSLLSNACLLIRQTANHTLTISCEDKLAKPLEPPPLSRLIRRVAAAACARHELCQRSIAEQNLVDLVDTARSFVRKGFYCVTVLTIAWFCVRGGISLWQIRNRRKRAIRNSFELEFAEGISEDGAARPDPPLQLVPEWQPQIDAGIDAGTARLRRNNKNVPDIEEVNRLIGRPDEEPWTPLKMYQQSARSYPKDLVEAFKGHDPVPSTPSGPLAANALSNYPSVLSLSSTSSSSVAAYDPLEYSSDSEDRLMDWTWHQQGSPGVAEDQERFGVLFDWFGSLGKETGYRFDVEPLSNVKLCESFMPVSDQNGSRKRKRSITSANRWD